MSNGKVLWTSALALVSALAVWIAAEYSILLAIIIWSGMTVVLLALRPE